MWNEPRFSKLIFVGWRVRAECERLGQRVIHVYVYELHRAAKWIQTFTVTCNTHTQILACASKTASPERRFCFLHCKTRSPASFSLTGRRSLHFVKYFFMKKYIISCCYTIFCQGSSGPEDFFDEDCYSPSSLSSSSSVPPVASLPGTSVCTSCGLEIVDRYLLKVSGL